MEPEAVALGERAETLDRIDQAIGKGRRGADDHDRVGPDRASHRIKIGAMVNALRHAHGLETEDLRRLVEGRVRGARHDNF
ncbi:MAG: hypothetical protein EXQ99_01055 [Alphaproteobacteria bacterium]|nr:hypothetical protein [Alphaproteobacteria bacterium]